MPVALCGFPSLNVRTLLVAHHAVFLSHVLVQCSLAWGSASAQHIAPAMLNSFPSTLRPACGCHTILSTFVRAHFTSPYLNFSCHGGTLNICFHCFTRHVGGLSAREAFRRRAPTSQRSAVNVGAEDLSPLPPAHRHGVGADPYGPPPAQRSGIRSAPTSHHAAYAGGGAAADLDELSAYVRASLAAESPEYAALDAAAGYVPEPSPSSVDGSGTRRRRTREFEDHYSQSVSPRRGVGSGSGHKSPLYARNSLPAGGAFPSSAGYSRRAPSSYDGAAAAAAGQLPYDLDYDASLRYRSVCILSSAVAHFLLSFAHRLVRKLNELRFVSQYTWPRVVVFPRGLWYDDRCGLLPYDISKGDSVRQRPWSTVRGNTIKR